jgi:hypothetical protein
MTGAVATRRLFLLAVAIVAAAVADPAVELVANTGILGGHYADNNHLSVIPALVVGGSLALLVLVARCIDVWRSGASNGDWLLDAARAFSARPPLRDLPSVLVLQLVALFLMESSEQLAQGGKLLGGAAWLGGPVAFSLLAHALIGAGCLLALGSFMRAILRTFASLVRLVIRFVWLAIARESGGFRLGSRETARLRSQSTYVHQIGGRAPPLLHTPA